MDSLSDEIHVLSAVVADRIAAGEVVERPASIVKELVENALDAGASEIEVVVEAGGRDRVVVRDNGRGMSPGDAERACLRHATSKLRAIEDLDDIGSFGFRGEALASIASVSETTILTRRAEDEEGTRVRIVQGEVAEVVPAGVPLGTQVEVEALFASVPARRKFLRTAQTELAHISDWLQRAALAHPEVAFALQHGAREVFRHPAVREEAERLRQVQGPSRAGEMVPCAGAYGGVQVRGWVSRAGVSYAQSKSILTWVGGRVVRDRVLTRAVLDAYRALMPQGRYPAVVLFLDVPPGTVDVNVHPTKIEVRFADGDAVYGAVLRTVRAALDDAVRAPEAADPGDATGPAAGSAAAGSGAGGATAAGEGTTAALARYAERSAAGGGRDAPEGGRSYRLRGVSADGRSAAPRQRAMGFAASPAGARPAPAPGSVAGEDAPGASAESGAADARIPRFGDLRVIGQALNGYIICEAADGLVLIDQHAAHERVRFERLRAQAAEELPSQQLLVPAVVALDAAALAVLEENADELRAAGFEVESFGEGKLALRAIPASLDVTTDTETLLADLARDLLAAGTTGAAERRRAARDTLIARVACHGAVRIGDPLEAEEMRRLVADLDTIPFAATCPHGRPLLSELPRSEIERRVLR